MKALPDNVTAYKQTPEFDNDTVPNGLLKSHNTRAGVWGEIVVIAGALTYRILEPDVEEIELDPDTPGVVEPTVRHEVALKPGTRFFVRFYR